MAVQGVHCPVQTAGVLGSSSVADLTHTSLAATRPLPHEEGNGGTQHQSLVTAFLPAHNMEMANKEGQVWNAVWTGAWR